MSCSIIVAVDRVISRHCERRSIGRAEGKKAAQLEEETAQSQWDSIILY
jgi:hypothetical protein